jgi:hypothetical protein
MSPNFRTSRRNAECQKVKITDVGQRNEAVQTIALSPPTSFITTIGRVQEDTAGSWL